jgi:3D (Asp-Asp-Asp) domain-containing protein
MGHKIKIFLTVFGLILISLLVFYQTGYGFIKKEEQEEKVIKPSPQVLSSKVWLTAYSSSPDETDDTPFITASGERVKDGIVAANFLPLHSTIQIPEVFGDKVFVVKDRMHSRKTNFVDIWMPSKEAAEEFGIRETEIIIIDWPSSELSLVR